MAKHNYVTDEVVIDGLYGHSRIIMHCTECGEVISKRIPAPPEEEQS